jgi:hypothetical protein
MGRNQEVIAGHGDGVYIGRIGKLPVFREGFIWGGVID